MNRKIITICVLALLIATAIPAVGTMNEFTKETCSTITSTSKTILASSDNGMIIDQELNEDGQGYTVMGVWGSYYEMGYAHAELLGDYIVQGVDEIKALLGGNYDSIKESITDSVWIPSEVENELDGMVDSLATTHPSADIDINDLKVYNTAGDWLYGFACRSHSCWDRYVAEPIKTLSTRRLDYPTIVPSVNHHLLCAYIPDDGSLQWINLAFPGYVAVATGVNEYGTLAAVHDWVPMSSPDISPDRMSRLVAIRYALTYPTDPDISTHLNSVFTEMQNYEIMTLSFVNYYVPEGNGGVMTCDPWQSGPDFYDLRLPQVSWHHGEAIITTNEWTDGTYTPSDEDFGADAYYDDETPKTLESHWDLLMTSGGSKNLHRLSVAYRDRGDMTIWVDGRLDGIGRTPRLEYEWEDLVDSESLNAPDSDGLENSFQGKNPIDNTLVDGWIKTYGGDGIDFGECVQQTSDGGYILALETDSYGAGDVDFWLIKTDSDGNEEWDMTFGGSAYEMPNFVQQTSDGGYILVGFTSSFGAGDHDVWLIKTDAYGNLDWDRTYGGAEYDFGYTVYETVDGYIIGAGTASYGAGDFDYWLIKTDFDGNLEWDKTFGGSGSETCRRMVQTADGGYIISGFAVSTEIFGKATCWLVKTDVDGNKLWDKTIEGTRHSLPWSIRQTTDGGYIITGATNGFAIGQIFLGGGDMWLVKTDAEGNKEWEKSFGRRIFQDGGWDVELKDDGGYIVVGFTKGLGSVIKQTPGIPSWSKAWVVETDGDGNMERETEYSRGMCLNIGQTSGGGHIITGGEKPFAEGDAFLIKI